jgi:Tfp pilus assembly protein PilF
MWRARIQTILDPTNPIESVKECYDKVYERLAGKDESYNTERKECLVYSAFYYFKKDDYDSAKDYCEKVLAIDPNHGLAKNILNAIAQLKK